MSGNADSILMERIAHLILAILLAASLVGCFNVVAPMDSIQAPQGQLAIQQKQDSGVSELHDELSLLETESAAQFQIFDRVDKNLRPISAQWRLEGQIGDLLIRAGGHQAELIGLRPGVGFISIQTVNQSKRIRIEVLAVEAPTANTDRVFINRGESITISPLDNDLAGSSGGDLELVSVGSSSHGVATQVGERLSIQPDADFYGRVSVEYVVQNSRGKQATGWVEVYVMTPHTWTGAAGNGQWSDNNNWCGTVVAGTCTGGQIPPPEAVAVFNSACNSSCQVVMNQTIDVAGIEMQSDFIGRIEQGSGVTINVDEHYWVQRAGTFWGSDADINLQKLQIYGGVFRNTNSQLVFNSGLLNGQEADFYRRIFFVDTGAEFQPQQSKVVFDYSVYTDGTASLMNRGNIGSIEINGTSRFYDLEIDLADTNNYGGRNNVVMHIAGTQDLVVENNLDFRDGQLRGGQIALLGHYQLYCVDGNLCAGGGDTFIEMRGVAPQSITAELNSLSPHLSIRNPAGVQVVSNYLGLQILHIHEGEFRAPTGTLEFRGNIMSHSNPDLFDRSFYVSGGRFVHNGGSLLWHQTAYTDGNQLNSGWVAGIESSQRLDLQHFSVRITDTNNHGGRNNPILKIAPQTHIQVEGDFSWSDGQIRGGRLDLQGHAQLTCESSEICAGGSNTSLYFSGESEQLISQQVGAANFNSSWRIEKSSGSLSLASPLGLGSNSSLAVVSGRLDLAGYLMEIAGSVQIQSPGIIVLNGGELRYGGTCSDDAVSLCP